MKKVSDIFERRGRQMFTVPKKTLVIDALKMMAENNIGSVIVMEGNKFEGLVTERDYSRKVILKGKSSSYTYVSDIMTTDLPRVEPHNTLEECMHLMAEHNIRYLPVFEGEQIHSIISINDLIKETILSQQETIEQLHDYIDGKVR
jgi:CBS domain-containing protein